MLVISIIYQNNVWLDLKIHNQFILMFSSMLNLLSKIKKEHWKRIHMTNFEL